MADYMEWPQTQEWGGLKSIEACRYFVDHHETWAVRLEFYPEAPGLAGPIFFKRERTLSDALRSVADDVERLIYGVR